ncbi:hypothetical protein [Candidatus Aalborgicola defluviihabitans]|uniref:hypothetical protein n=1 Tax=Candidatus Aalborgicola defluviihabitans TaxID=3386187 RepID=UPI001EC99E1A|nr:hypothetical protein [Burkholderiales bacterium]
MFLFYWFAVLIVPGGGGAPSSMVAAGDDHNFALKTDGTVVAWGANYDGQLVTAFGPPTATARLR